MELTGVLARLKNGEITLEEAEELVKISNYKELEDIAKIDTHRARRTGIPEAIIAEGKNPQDLLEIARAYLEKEGRAIITRLPEANLKPLKELAAQQKVECHWNPRARIAILGDRAKPTGARIGVICAGTSDIPVAEEAKTIAEEMGCQVATLYDVGVAGIHRLLPGLTRLVKAKVDAIVVAAGREGTLPAIVAGLVDTPVIGVPVSTGYGAGAQGKAALLSMLQSCSVITVVNIDAGFTAGAFAAQIANRMAKLKKENQQ